MPDYAWGIQLEDDRDEPTAHVVDFDTGVTALCGVSAVLRFYGEQSLPVCEECVQQALAEGIITRTDSSHSDRFDQDSDQKVFK